MDVSLLNHRYMHINKKLKELKKKSNKDEIQEHKTHYFSSDATQPVDSLCIEQK